MRKSIIIEKRGLKGDEIAGWFIRNGGRPSRAHRLDGPGWQVDFLEEGIHMLGPMHFPVVLLRIEAEQDIFEGFLKRFRTHFLRGGA